MKNASKIIAATITLTALLSCGKMDHNIKGIPDHIEADAKIDDGYEDLYDFCDNRYGYMTSESDTCVEKGLAYRGFKLGFDFKSITEFCKDAEDIVACENLFINTLKKYSVE